MWKFPRAASQEEIADFVRRVLQQHLQLKAAPEEAREANPALEAAAAGSIAAQSGEVAA